MLEPLPGVLIARQQATGCRADSAIELLVLGGTVETLAVQGCGVGE